MKFHPCKIVYLKKYDEVAFFSPFDFFIDLHDEHIWVNFLDNINIDIKEQNEKLSIWIFLKTNNKELNHNNQQNKVFIW